MALRLSRTTRPLCGQVTAARQTLHVLVAVGGNPTAFGLIARSVTGLVVLVLDTRQPQPRISEKLPARCHDARNRLLRVLPVLPRSTRALLAGLLRCAKQVSQRLGTLGYRCVDDVVSEKPVAKVLPWAAGTSSPAKKQKVYGGHSVRLSWTSDPAGTWRSPVAFRLWRPTRACAPGRYQQKTDLVGAMLWEVVAARCPAAYLVGDTASTGGPVSKTAARLGRVWVGTIAPRTTVVFRGRRRQVQHLAPRLKRTWRPTLGVRAIALLVYAPSLGPVRLVVLTNEHGNYEYLVTNDLPGDLTLLVQRKRRRWRIETIFRATKQLAGLAACQCWVDQALVRQVALVCLACVVACVVLQVLRRAPQETVGAVKARCQGEILRDGQPPPQPLRAAPRACRIK